MNEQDNQNSETTTPVEAYSLQSPPEAPPSVVPVLLEKPAKRRLEFLIAAGVAVLLVAAGLLWYFMLRDLGATNEHAANTSDELNRAIIGQPDQLIYNRSGSLTRQETIYAASIESGEETEVMALPFGISATYAITYGRQVAFVAQGDSTASDQAAIYYSSDSGKSYEKIYSASNSDVSVGLGTQITSLIFSNDGTALLAGVLLAEEIETDSGVSGIHRENQVTEIVLDHDNQATVLFTSKYPGVLLKGYDRSNHKAFYLLSGCYNCEPYYEGIYSHDLQADTEELLYDSDSFPSILPTNISINKAATKVLVLEMTSGSRYSTSNVSYELFTIDTSTKAKDSIETFTDGRALRQAGYTHEDVPYIATDTKVQEVVVDGATTLFELADGNDAFGTPWVLFAGKYGVVADVMTSVQGDNLSTAQFSVLLSKDVSATPSNVIERGSMNGDIQVMGVTQK